MKRRSVGRSYRRHPVTPGPEGCDVCGLGLHPHQQWSVLAFSDGRQFFFCPICAVIMRQRWERDGYSIEHRTCGSVEELSEYVEHQENEYHRR